MNEAKIFLDCLRNEPVWMYYIIGALLVLLLALVLLRRLRQPGELLAFSTERGRVLIARKAISDMIQKAASRTPGVVKCRSRLAERRGELSLRLRISLRADSDLREVQKRLEAQIVDSLKYNLGFSSLGEFVTTVVAVVGEPEQRRGSSMSALRSLRPGEDEGDVTLPPREDLSAVERKLITEEEEDERQ